MSILTAATNIYFNAMCAFYAIMCLVGFLLIRTDKKRWNAQKARSDLMMQGKKKPAEDEAATDKKGKKDKKAKKEEPYEYQERIPDKVFFIIAILFGALGELLGMAVYRHKWYKFAFRAYIPALAFVNIIIVAVILYFLYQMGDATIAYTN